MLVLLLAMLQVAAADCVQQLQAALDSAEDAFRAGEARRVVDAVVEAREAVGCVEVALQPTTCARLHRAEALVEHISGGSRADTWLQAMRWSDPWLAWDVADADHPLTLQLYAVEEEVPALARPLPRLGSGSWRVDGTPMVRASATHPFLAQQIDPGGSVMRTYRVDAGARLPMERRGGKGWAIAGASAGVVAGALYGGAWAGRAGYNDAVARGDDAAITRMHGVTNGLSVGALGAAGVSLGLLAIGVTR